MATAGRPQLTQSAARGEAKDLRAPFKPKIPDQNQMRSVMAGLRKLEERREEDSLRCAELSDLLRSLLDEEDEPTLPPERLIRLGDWIPAAKDPKSKKTQLGPKQSRDHGESSKTRGRDDSAKSRGDRDSRQKSHPQYQVELQNKFCALNEECDTDEDGSETASESFGQELDVVSTNSCGDEADIEEARPSPVREIRGKHKMTAPADSTNSQQSKKPTPAAAEKKFQMNRNSTTDGQ